jgi:hypothetical protein
MGNFTKSERGNKSPKQPEGCDDLHRKLAAVTLDLSCGMVRQILKKGVPLEPVFAGQMLAVMETAMAGFGLTAEQAADLVADFC